jgi:hypothetical protein
VTPNRRRKPHCCKSLIPYKRPTTQNAFYNQDGWVSSPTIALHAYITVPLVLVSFCSCIIVHYNLPVQSQSHCSDQPTRNHSTRSYTLSHTLHRSCTKSELIYDQPIRTSISTAFCTTPTSHYNHGIPYSAIHLPNAVNKQRTPMGNRL